MKSLRLIALLLLLPNSSFGTRYYVSTTGSDTNAGSFDQPFLTIAKAVALSSTLFAPGDTVFVRGGTYPVPGQLTLSKTGTLAAPYHLLAYPGERALLDFSTTALGVRGIRLSGSYWIVRGIDVKGAGDNGMMISGSNNRIENCSFFENRDTGLQLGGGASNNRIVNCDSYDNADPGGGNADGFAAKLDVGTGNAFAGCRAWQNSDDGWDGYLRPANDVTTTYDSCWCFANGFLKDGSPSNGNGNGFKMGGSDARDLMHNAILRHCVAFDNRVKGFDQNNNRGSMTLYNCSGYRNGTLNFAIADTVAVSRGKVVTVMNSVALGFFGSLNPATIQQTNSWLPPFGAVVESGFVSVDTAGMRAPRKPDGSLPDVRFLVPAPGSPLVDAGTDLGLPYFGTKPDLGAFETHPPDAVGPGPEGIASALTLENYPNPFNPLTRIALQTENSEFLILKVFDAAGREVATLLEEARPPGKYMLEFDASSLATGVYFCRLQAGAATIARKLVLLR